MNKGNYQEIENQSVIVRAYRMHLTMMRYPESISRVREIFLSKLSERGIAAAEDIDRSVLEHFSRKENGEKSTGYRDALIDLVTVEHFDDVELNEFINLARKEELFRVLVRILNSENTTYHQIKKALRDFCAIPQGSLYISPSEAEGVRVSLIDQFISNQLPFIGVAKEHITIRDADEIINRTIWNRRRHGLIGGKAAGMLSAYRALIPRLEEPDPEFSRYIAIPDSYYISSGTFADFVDYNNLDYYHSHKYGSRAELEKRYEEMSNLLETTKFPPDVVDQFRDLIAQVGEHPLIVRSSSLLEDNFGHAFSGKYDSVFLANQGNIDDRLDNFIKAVKRVHNSTLAPAPIIYRKDHNLLDFDEKMGVLVQKVVGRRYGDYFFPMAAGVAFSFNAYNWTPKIRQQDGLARLVFGLGSGAVDRREQDYSRMIPLSHPLLRPEIDVAQISKYSQRQADVINLKSGMFETVHIADLLKKIHCPDAFFSLSANEDGRLAAPLSKLQAIDPDRSVVTFENLLTKTPFARILKRVLSFLERVYKQPVDVEFAWDNNTLYILQCRPLLVSGMLERVAIPDVPIEKILFTNDSFVSNDIVHDIEYIVYVDPKAYARLKDYQSRVKIGRVINRLNKRLEDKRYALFGPGRWGSNDIRLGVKVGYEDINRTLILGEIAFEEDGMTPEVSYGTHFFIDLVEAAIVPVAVFPDKKGAVFKEKFFVESDNILGSLMEDCRECEDVVRVIHVPSSAGDRYFHVYQDASNQKGMGFLAYKGEYGEFPEVCQA